MCFFSKFFAFIRVLSKDIFLLERSSTSGSNGRTLKRTQVRSTSTIHHIKSQQSLITNSCRRPCPILLTIDTEGKRGRGEIESELITRVKFLNKFTITSRPSGNSYAKKTQRNTTREQKKPKQTTNKKKNKSKQTNSKQKNNYIQQQQLQ